MNCTLARRGFTLVELLVVAGLIAVFFGLVVSAMRPTAESQIRQAAQSVASALVTTQTRALGSDNGAVLIITPSGTNSPLSAYLFNADVLPPISGMMTVPPLASTPSPLSYVDFIASQRIDPTSIQNGSFSDLQSAFKFRIWLSGIANGPPSPWFGFAPQAVLVDANGNPSSTAQVRLSLRTAAGQSRDNTIWPSRSILSRFEVARLPAPSALLLSLPAAAAIDLRYSGVGDDFSIPSGGTIDETQWGSFWSRNFSNNKGSIAVEFSPVGLVSAMLQRVGSPPTLTTIDPLQPASPIYLLVTARDDIDSTTIHTPRALANQYASWVVIDPTTGRVHVSPNVPQNFTFTIPSAPHTSTPRRFAVTNWSQSSDPNSVYDFALVLRAARKKARETLPFGK